MEIERKFLVRGDDYKRCAHKSYSIRQGYISSGQGRTVRVRIRDNQGFLTIKGPSLDGGLSRYEFDKEITLDELVMAEVELSSADEPFEKPDFIEKEVTGDHRYYNSHLRKNPYKLWKEEG